MLEKIKNFIKNLTPIYTNPFNHDNWGYSTPLQKRYKKETKLKISEQKIDRHDKRFPVGCDVWIVETGRHDYLIRNSDGEYTVVYQYELEK